MKTIFTLLHGRYFLVFFSNSNNCNKFFQPMDGVWSVHSRFRRFFSIQYSLNITWQFQKIYYIQHSISPEPEDPDPSWIRKCFHCSSSSDIICYRFNNQHSEYELHLLAMDFRFDSFALWNQIYNEADLLKPTT